MNPFQSVAVRDHTVLKLWGQIEQNIDNPDLSVTDLLESAAMSRTNLYRRLTAKTGMSATAFIRYVRLTKARDLLLDQTDLTISEIAFSVGFNSLSYFTKRFTEVFGVCPRRYQETHELKPLSEHPFKFLEHALKG
ncbi:MULTISPECIES: helix-turn-helix transcriptional regulator [Larkinella]|uniref:Helix-turn-helix transcriptional regulator n=1 Tax=Larkinella humicola TaxID=2607654 RepID=A0A5N1JI49_9BACT|nr:helix-turn-helix transcriptional regulator [Larkinella humicola]KAA9355065.1 helix-turn-helix transcriptional regulator [Larkinella humicola]